MLYSLKKKLFHENWRTNSILSFPLTGGMGTSYSLPRTPEDFLSNLEEMDTSEGGELDKFNRYNNVAAWCQQYAGTFRPTSIQTTPRHPGRPSHRTDLYSLPTNSKIFFYDIFHPFGTRTPAFYISYFLDICAVWTGVGAWI